MRKIMTLSPTVSVLVPLFHCFLWSCFPRGDILCVHIQLLHISRKYTHAPRTLTPDTPTVPESPWRSPLTRPPFVPILCPSHAHSLSPPLRGALALSCLGPQAPTHSADRGSDLPSWGALPAGVAHVELPFNCIFICQSEYCYKKHWSFINICFIDFFL